MSERPPELRVLIVDDDAMVARVHQGFVERIDGFTAVGEARTGGDAVTAVGSLRPDIVLLDVYLPDLSGLEVLERLRGTEEARGVDVVMITAAKDVDTVSRALRSGALHFLIKPFVFEDLRSRLQHVAETRRSLTDSSTSVDLAQRDVDRFFAADALARGQHLPAGLAPQTMERVIARLRAEVGDRSASQIGAGIGVSRVSARRYLEHLVSTGQADVTLRYGETGRPERRYRWNEGRGTA